MLMEQCKSCKHVVWLVALGQEVRCKHPDHNRLDHIPIPISEIKDCKKFESIKKDLSKTTI